MTDERAMTRETNKQTLRRLMAAITALDVEAATAEMTDGAVVEFPYESAVPDCDPDGFGRLLSIISVMFAKYEMTITDIYDLVDPNILVVQYRSDALGRDKPVEYRNDYIAVIHFDRAKVLRWREYANPEVAHAAIAKFADDTKSVAG